MTASKHSTYETDLETERTLVKYVRDIWKVAPDTKISARMLADKMEINVASIYGLFDTMNELYYYGSVYFLEYYAREMPGRIAGISNPLVSYMETCKCFSENVFRYPYAYQVIFNNKYAKEHNRMIEHYRELFPGEIDDRMMCYMPTIVGNDLHTRDVKMLLKAAKTGMLPLNAITFIASANTVLIRSTVERVLAGEMKEVDFSEKVKMVTSAQAHQLLGYCLHYEEAKALLAPYLEIPDPNLFL